MALSIEDHKRRLEEERTAIELSLAADASPARGGGSETSGPSAHALFSTWQKINDAIAILSDAILQSHSARPSDTHTARAPSIAQKIAPLSAEQVPKGKPIELGGLPAGALELLRIKGLDAATAAQLATPGIVSIAEIAKWTAADVARVSQQLSLGRRINKENWIEQAAMLVIKAGAAERVAAIAPPNSKPVEPAPVTLPVIVQTAAKVADPPIAATPPSPVAVSPSAEKAVEKITLPASAPLHPSPPQQPARSAPTTPIVAAPAVMAATVPSAAVIYTDQAESDSADEIEVRIVRRPDALSNMPPDEKRTGPKPNSIPARKPVLGRQENSTKFGDVEIRLSQDVNSPIWTPSSNEPQSKSGKVLHRWLTSVRQRLQNRE